MSLQDICNSTFRNIDSTFIQYYIQPLRILNSKLILTQKRNILKTYFIYFHLGTLQSISRNHFNQTRIKNFIMLCLLFYPIWFFTYKKYYFRRVRLMAVPRKCSRINDFNIKLSNIVSTLQQH